MNNARESQAPAHRSGRRIRNGFVAALELVVKHGRQTLAPVPEAPYRKCCPKCGWTGLTDRDFGMRIVRGRRVPQSWCRLCRKATADTASRRRGKVEEPASAWLFPSL